MYRTFAVLLLVTVGIFIGGWTLQSGAVAVDLSGFTFSIPSSQKGRAVPPGMKEHLNTKYSFSLLYPEQLSVMEHFEFGDAATITFEETKEPRGFQIFIVPYAEAQVGEERFLLDNPSGVRNEPMDIQIDGATAVSFYSTDPSVGETAEIWFVHGGYLYEVTTLKSLAPWLSEIMASWKFL